MTDEIGDDFFSIYDNPTPMLTSEERAAARSAVDVEIEAERHLRERRVAYQRVFVLGMATPDDVQLIMLDLAKFCRGFESTFHEDMAHHNRLDGRREEFLRIMDFTKLDYDELMLKYHRR